VRIGFLEPHLRRYGGIRRAIEFSNRLIDRGHEVFVYVPATEPLRCEWTPLHAEVRHIPEGFRDVLDVLIFNHEPQWYLIDLFEHAKRRVFYALHDGSLYGKEGSWEAARAPVDAIFANSSWTAERLTRASGRDVPVALGGINPGHFRPLTVPKRYPVLTVGDTRDWKGLSTVTDAARIAGIPVETYAGKNLPQDAMANEYSAAEVFAVGSWYEGFGQPGLEALACGTALVTTDNGGSREYAIDGETALVVQPGDAHGMAAAIARLRADSDLRARLRVNGHQLVREKFNWEKNTAHLELLLRKVIDEAAHAAPPLHQEQQDPELSVVVLAWDQLLYTQRCVQSLRQSTDVSWELVIVDNGSDWDARHYAAVAADRPVLHDKNLGFAAGMNAGLAVSRGRYVAFCNNDTEFPPGWASQLIQSHKRHPNAGITVPAVTEARNGRTVRDSPGEDVVLLDPFEPPPAAVVYLMDRAIAAELEGWSEEYPVASGEDLDLAFNIWVNDLDIVFDERVLVAHVGKGTAAVKLPDWRTLWAANGQLFLTKWTSPDLEVRRLQRCPRAVHARNVRTARAVAGWMTRYFAEKERASPYRKSLRRVVALLRRTSGHALTERVAVAAWRRAGPLLPQRLRRTLRAGLAGSLDRKQMNRPQRVSSAEATTVPDVLVQHVTTNRPPSRN
jgi:glycosyltransferase involved in cell wall biosynthesis/GT2 family glycosyltransferase